jgi:hypothetical protein
MGSFSDQGSRDADGSFSAKPLAASLADVSEKNSRWKLLINEPVEIDS